MGVRACPRNCAESGIKDIGFIGVDGGWEIYVGGNGGMDLRAGRPALYGENGTRSSWK